MTRILGFETHDLRFPTSRNLDGSDAMNSAPDYSAAYLTVQTDGNARTQQQDEASDDADEKCGGRDPDGDHLPTSLAVAVRDLSRAVDLGALAARLRRRGCAAEWPLDSIAPLTRRAR